jgi:hypothetical protein
VNELQVEKRKSDYILNLVIWCGQTGFVHTVWNIGKLYSSELGFKDNGRGGRFRRYDDFLRTNKVTLPITSKNKEVVVQKMLNWLGDSVESNWSMDFTTHDPVSISGGIGLACLDAELNLYFEDENEAVLCLLKFR